LPYKDRDAQRAYQRDWIRRRRADWLAANGPCSKCGTTEDLIAASPKPGKPIPHRVWTYSAKRRDAVLDGCVVLCRSCFRFHRWPAPEHGTLARYESRVHACRCDACKAARNLSERSRRKRRRARTPEDRAATVAAWRERERDRLLEKASALRPEHVREIAERWRREFVPVELPPLARDLGRAHVERVFLLIAASGRDGVVTGEIVHESALATSDATMLVGVLLRNGLVVRERSRLVARRVRRAELRMQRAAIEFHTLRRRCDDDDESGQTCVEVDADEPEDDERSRAPLDTLSRVMYRLFGYDV
jgi:DNA-binding MarR family transcriptional regulator